MTTPPRRRACLFSALAAATGYLVLTLLVAVGATQQLDDAVRERFRPDDTWGAAQTTTGPLIDALEPRRVFALLAVVALASVVRRRSWRPLAFAALVAVTAAAVTAASKYALHRTDPHAEVFGGGSFPSGHMLADLVCLGGIVLLLRRPAPWWAWLPVVAVELAMALALLFAAAHWFTDVVGGALLGAAVLLVAATLPLRSSARQAVRSPGPDRQGSAPASPARDALRPRRRAQPGARRSPVAPRTTR